VLRALIDVAVVFSACPMDLVPISGEGAPVRDVHAEVLAS